MDMSLLNEEVNQDIVSFINESNEEFLRVHYANGVKRPGYRSRSEKVENCRRAIGWGIGEDGNYRIVREFPCHIITGEGACPYCIKVRNFKRERDFSYRIDNVENRSLYFLNVKNKDEANRLKANCHYHGYSYLSVPVSSSGEKLVIADGPVKGSFPISAEDAKRKLSVASGFISEKRNIRAGGSLGNTEDIEKIDWRNRIDIDIEVTGFVGPEPSLIETSQAYIMAMIKIGDRTVITKENVQEMFTARQQRVKDIYLKMGYRPYVRFVKKEAMDFDSISTRWSEILLKSPEITGSMAALDSVTRKIMSLSMEELTAVLENDSKVVENIVANSARQLARKGASG